MIVIDFFWREHKTYAAPEFDTLAKAIRYAAQVKRNARKVHAQTNIFLYYEGCDPDFSIAL